MAEKGDEVVIKQLLDMDKDSYNSNEKYGQTPL
jgi:hypothetical protein